jgi:hypothetical protein
MTVDDPRVYDALALPNDALANGGTEILRAGVIDDELFVTARHAFADPAQWGEVLAEIAQRLARIYASSGEYSEAEALAAIESAFAAELGAAPAPRRKPPARRSSKKPSTKTSAKTSTKRPPRRSASRKGAKTLTKKTLTKKTLTDKTPAKKTSAKRRPAVNG